MDFTTEALGFMMLLIPGYLSAKLMQLRFGRARKSSDLERTLMYLTCSLVVYVLMYVFYTILRLNDGRITEANIFTFPKVLLNNGMLMAWSGLALTLLTIGVGIGGIVIAEIISKASGFTLNDVWQQYAQKAASGSVVEVLTKDGKEYYGILEVIGWDNKEILLKKPKQIVGKNKKKINFGESLYIPANNLATISILKITEPVKKELKFRWPIYFE